MLDHDQLSVEVGEKAVDLRVVRAGDDHAARSGGPDRRTRRVFEFDAVVNLKLERKREPPKSEGKQEESRP